MVFAIIVACCPSVFRLKLSRHRQACSVAFPALLWNPNHVRVWHSLYKCGLPHWVWTIWEPWFGESQKWTSVMLSPLERETHHYIDIKQKVHSVGQNFSSLLSKVCFPSNWYDCPFNGNARKWNEGDRLIWSSAWISQADLISVCLSHRVTESLSDWGVTARTALRDDRYILSPALTPRPVWRTQSCRKMKKKSRQRSKR